MRLKLAMLVLVASTVAANAQCYVRGGVGGAMATTEISVGPLSADGIGSSGHVAAVRGGCDVAVAGNVRFGAFAEYAFKNVAFNVEPSLLSAKFGDAWSIGARAAYRHGSALPYVFATYTEQQMSWSIPIDAPRFRGIGLGAGVELDIGKGWFTGLEGRVTRFNGETIAGLVKLEPTELQLLATVGYRF